MPRNKQMKNCLLSLALIVLVAGCSSAGGSSSKEDEVKADRLETIAKQSGGDWNKVSDSDRQYVINEVSHGSEESAKRLVQMKGSRPAGMPGPPKH